MSNRGAEFRKTDFQIHSPRDNGWEGPRPEDAPSPKEVLDARETFCRAFLTKCIDEGLRAIAVTDHHEGVYCYRIIEAKARLEAEEGPIDLWVFPGMELTCKDSCQALILFDASLPVGLFEKARAKLGLPADTKPESPKGIQVELLDFNVADLQDLLDTDAELRGRFIIFPHVKPSGHKTVLRNGFHKRFKELPYVGGYMDQCYPDDLNPGDRKILDGEIPAWASEKRGVFSCSDARHADFRLIGKHATWIKLASPTAESLRQAMLAPDSRIRYEEPILPSAMIASITVQGSKYLKDGTYNFNQQMNSVIGGRGAGKSTLLEYVRFALGCSAIDGASSQGRNSERLHELLLSTLDQTTGSVSLDVLLNGASVVLTRQMAKRSVIDVNAAGSATSSSVDEVRRLIPTQQYRQGELSELAREDAADRLLRLITGQVATQIGEIEARLLRNGQSLSEALAKAVRLSAATQTKGHVETQSNLIKAQVENLQRQLVSSNQPATPAIADHDKYLRQKFTLEGTTVRLDAMRDKFSDLMDDFINELKTFADEQPIIQGTEKLTSAFKALRADLDDTTDPKGEFRLQCDALAGWFDATITSFNLAATEWTPVFDKHQSSYEEQRKALQGKQSVLDSIEALTAQSRTAANALEAAMSEEATLRDADRQLENLRSERAKLQLDLHAIVEQQVATIQAVSSGLARGQLADLPDIDEVNEALHKILDLPMLRESRVESLVGSVTKAKDISTQWRLLQDELIALVKWKAGAIMDKGVPPATPILHAALDDGFMDKLRERISADRVATALHAILRPRVEILQLRDGEEIEFRKASQGEQAATLLNILMNQSNGPLIIDQPEEDLDNRIINDIIRTIRKTKDERQLILATHNANIAVNGDSENVIEMVLGKQGACGAIDEPRVRDAITKTMEGGKDAFELRRKKYNF